LRHQLTRCLQVFHGYTLGCCAAVGLVGCVYAAGRALHRLRGGALSDKRFYSFTNRCVTAALVVLYLAYPAVSQVAVNMLSCQQLVDADGEGAAYLRADFRISCFTPQHNAHRAAAVFWIIVFPVGVPLLFYGALRYYRVPQMARAKEDAGWLQACCDLAARHAKLRAPPDVEPRLLTADNIPEAYLAALHALFCADSAADEEQDARSCCAWLRPGRAAPAAAAPLTREALLQQLLHWCRTSEKLSLPPLQWQLKHRLEEEADTPFALAAPPLPPTAEEKLAEDRIGFLFEAYKPQCYYWEVFELVRKFLLTGVMSMVSPGSAAQVVMGLLVSFAAVVLYSRFNPYLERSVNTTKRRS
jgi:hypothetical protein